MKTFEEILNEAAEQWDYFGLGDARGHRDRMKKAAIRKLRNLDFAPWVWAALAKKAEELNAPLEDREEMQRG